MPDLVTTIGPVSLRSFNLFLGLALTGAVALAAYQLRDRAAPGRVFDAFLVTLAGAALGGRLAHVALSWDYFSLHADEILRLNAGGLSWHGALVGGLFGLLLAARWRRLPALALLDVLTPVPPLLALGVWYGCWAAACGYGAEVDTLAHYPSYLVSESRDVYGLLAPRYDTQVFGMVWSLALLPIAGLLMRVEALRGARFWLVLALLAAGMFALGFVRGDATAILAGLRADQWLDGAVVVFSLVAAVVGLRRRLASASL